jgi:hypothetical protein
VTVSNNCETFSCEKAGLIYPIMGIIGLVTIFPASTLAAISFSQDMVRAFNRGEPIDFDQLFWALFSIGAIIAAFKGSLVIGNICNAIQVCDRGLKVRVFTLFRPWRFIPWSEVTGIETSSLIWHRDQLVWIIKVKKLTRWHKRLCYAYRVGYQPGIIITPYVQNRFELLDMVQKKIDEQNTGLEI